MAVSALTLAVFTCLVAAPAAPTPTLNDLLQQARAERARSVASQPSPPPDWPADAAAQAAALAALAGRLDAARARRTQLDASFAANAEALVQARTQLAAELGPLADVVAAARETAREVRAALDRSLVSAELGQRRDLLAPLLRDDRLPVLADLAALAFVMHEEMTEQAKATRFAAPVFAADGIATQREVVRLGAFGLYAGDRFVRFDADTNSLRLPARQPAARYRSQAARLAAATDGVVAAPLDPTRGALLDALVRAPGPVGRAVQGGFVGYVILTLGAFGALVAAWRGAALTVSGRRMARQLRAAQPRPDNALGRVLAAASADPSQDPDTLERQLDEAVALEVPRLERWLGALRVVAAVAPLLGLLGTVIGMIETFQSITLQGTGDARLMADGISKALVTTMLGLIVAIPMVLVHTVIAAMSRRQIEMLEAHSAGLIARRSEAG